MTKFTIFIISWILIGFMSLIILVINDLRGKEYDENYFDLTFFAISVLSVVFGYLSLIGVIVIILSEFHSIHNSISKTIYNIANIGVKSKKDKE